jgi:hypothetical protein
MPSYDVCVRKCPECGQTHPLGVQVEMDEEPDLREPIKGSELPNGKVLDQYTYHCPERQIMVKRGENDQLILVPIGQ